VNLRDLEYLVAVADHHHFGAAATATFVSQPTLSTQLRKLEAELGVELIERSPRRVTLTPAGERIVTEARAVLERVASIRALARAARDPESATIRLGLFPTVAPYLLPHVVPLLHATFPRLELLLVEEKTEVLTDQLRDGRLDAAVLARPVHDDQLTEQLLFVEDFVLAVPADHRLAGSLDPVPTSELADEQVLLLEEGHCLRDQALAVCHLAGASERNGFRATSLETMRQMVAAGVGVTLLPRLAVEPPVPASPDVRILRFADPVPRREIAMYWRRTSPYRDFLPRLADVVGQVAPELLRSPTELAVSGGPPPAARP
jgi:LysR family hydrogen peroxide-inducible transcriptional activator